MTACTARRFRPAQNKSMFGVQESSTQLRPRVECQEDRAALRERTCDHRTERSPHALEGPAPAEPASKVWEKRAMNWHSEVRGRRRRPEAASAEGMVRSRIELHTLAEDDARELARHSVAVLVMVLRDKAREGEVSFGGGKIKMGVARCRLGSAGQMRKRSAERALVWQVRRLERREGGAREQTVLTSATSERCEAGEKTDKNAKASARAREARDTEEESISG